jgi:hypothetical protein
MNNYRLLFGIGQLCIFSNGVYTSWEYLNDYELQKENLKTPYKKIEKAVKGFSNGLFTGMVYTILSPIIIPGIIIANVHSNIKK